MPKAPIDDTLEMYYEDDNFTDPWKDTETLVFQHCNTGSSRLYYAWVPTVARHYRFIRVDRRGQGLSSVPAPGYAWSLKKWSDEMRVLLDHLGMQKVHLIGDATGAYVCLQYAHDHPDRVQSLTLINAVPNEADSKLAERPGVVPVPDKGLETWVWDSMKERFDPDKVDPGLIKWHGEEKLRQPHHVCIEVKESVGKGVLDSVAEMLTKLKVPTLVMSGETGVIHNPETARRLQEMIPDSKLTVLPGVFGYIASAAPEACADAWLDFARGLR